MDIIIALVEWHLDDVLLLIVLLVWMTSHVGVHIVNDVLVLFIVINIFIIVVVLKSQLDI